MIIPCTWPAVTMKFLADRVSKNEKDKIMRNLLISNDNFHEIQSKIFISRFFQEKVKKTFWSKFLK